MNELTSIEKTTAKDWASDQEVRWCPGCGDYSVLGSITKAGDGYLRRLLVHGARAVMRWHGKTSPWLAGLLKRRPVNVAVVALANKLASIVGTASAA